MTWRPLLISPYGGEDREAAARRAALARRAAEEAEIKASEVGRSSLRTSFTSTESAIVGVYKSCLVRCSVILPRATLLNAFEFNV
jgi:hypothetical protein